jgi:hypothetical protein
MDRMDKSESARTPKSGAGRLRYEPVTSKADEDAYDPFVPWNCSPVEEGNSAHIRLAADYGAELPLWGDWPADTRLPEDLRQRLAAWQQAFEDNMPGWNNPTSLGQWLSDGEALAASLRELLNDKATLEVDLL